MKCVFVAGITLLLASCQPLTAHPEGRAHWDCGGNTLDQSWKELELRVRDSTKAQKLANAILCMPESKKRNDYIDAHLDKLVEFSSFGTGDQEEERQVLNREMAKGQVHGFGGSKHYDYSARLDDQGNIWLDATSEACVEGFTLRHRGGFGWLITKSGSACD